MSPGEQGYGSVVVRARAPVRIDLAGGWTDVAEFAADVPGAVVNMAVDLSTYVTLTACRASDGVSIFAADLEEYETARDVQSLEFNGRVDLVKAAVKLLNIRSGVRIQTRSDAPPGSGLGTSAALGVALLGALGKFRRRTFLDYEVAELASFIERVKLKIKGGKQDHYASALGGVNFMEFFGDKVRSARIRLSVATRMYLEKHLLLVYTGKSRLSGDVHAHVWNAHRAGQSSTVGAIEEMKRIARMMMSDLLEGNTGNIADLISRNWECQKALHPSVTNPDFEELIQTARSAGAAGAKACGAGGGGCLLIMASPEREHEVRRAIEPFPSARIIPFTIESSGLEVAEYGEAVRQPAADCPTADEILREEFGGLDRDAG